jgi:hypothetical protein
MSQLERIDDAKAKMPEQFKEFMEHPLTQLPGSISPLAAEELLFTGALKGLKYLKGTPVGKQVTKKTSDFISEIDWGKWNKSIPGNKKLMKEYDAIESSAKADGTWMKNADGSKFEGTPEQFVQQQSENFKKAFPEGYNEVYRGVGPANNNPDFSKGFKEGDKAIFTADKDLAKEYEWGVSDIVKKQKDNFLTPGSSRTSSGIYHLGHPKGKQINYNTMGQDWASIDLSKGSNKIQLEWQLKKQKEHLKKLLDTGLNEDGIAFSKERIKSLEDYLENFDKMDNDVVAFNDMRRSVGDSPSTYRVASYLETTNLNNITLQNVVDGGLGDVTIVNNKPGNYLKSMIGNSGMFDMNNPNIFKSLSAPVGVGTVLANQGEGTFKNGGVIEDDRGQWAHPGKVTKINSNKITMKGVNYPVLGISNTGDKQLMQPGGEYSFDGESVTEFPIKAQKGVTLSPKEWNLQYVNSPKYKERLTSSGYKNVGDELDIRLSNINKAKIVENFKEDSYYDSHSKEININPIEQEFLQDQGSNVLSHEYGHAEIDGRDFTGRLNKEDYNQLYGRAHRAGAKGHDLDPRESKSDINALRYELMEQGIYDAGKEDFTEEHLNKSKKSFIKDRLLKNFNKEDLIYIMNNVADNTQKDSLPVAQKGKRIELDEVNVKGLSNASKIKAYRDSLNLYNKSKDEFHTSMVDIVDGAIENQKRNLEKHKEFVKEHPRFKDDIPEMETYLQELTDRRDSRLKSLQSLYNKDDKDRFYDVPEKQDLEKRVWTGMVGNGDGKFRETTNTWYNIKSQRPNKIFPTGVSEQQGDMILNNSIQPIGLLGWGEGGSYNIYKKPMAPKLTALSSDRADVIKIDTKEAPIVEKLNYAPIPEYFQLNRTDYHGEVTEGEKHYNNKKNQYSADDLIEKRDNWNKYKGRGRTSAEIVPKYKNGGWLDKYK